MTTFHIKIIAIFTMVIDHMGLFFFPDTLLFRLIGRLSFPLFAWLIASGAHHTKNIKIYLLRIFIFAFLSQVPYLLANRLTDQTYFHLNVLFTLGMGLAAIAVIQKTHNKLIWLIATGIAAAGAHYLQADYGHIGVFSVVAFYLFYKNIIQLITVQVFLTTLAFIHTVSGGDRGLLLQPVALASLMFIALYNGKQGPKIKYFFYIFFPLHYLIIYCIKVFF